MKAALGALLLVGCAQGSADIRARTALDVFAEVVDPAYSLAVDSCIERERDAVERAERGSDAAKAEYRSIQARCDWVRDQFEAIRVHHNQAAELVERGAISDAEAQIEQIYIAWRKLRAEERP